MPNTTFDHISAFTRAKPETQLKSIVQFILDNQIFIQPDIDKLEDRVLRYSDKIGVPYSSACYKIEKEVKRVVDERLQQSIWKTFFILK